MTFSLLTLLIAARERARREEGAVALATLGFMITLGIVSIVTLWSIAYATGAYNSLYAATQSAAYAAVGQTVPSTAGSGQGQLDFSCNGAPGASSTGSGGVVDCTGGNVMAIVDSTFSAAFPAPGGNLPGFGLTWDDNQTGSVQLDDINNQPISGAPYVFAYWVPQSAGSAYTQWQSEGEPTCPASVTIDGEGSELLCWAVREQTGVFYIGGTPQFSSGVVVRASAEIQIPGCVICARTRLVVVAAASEAQQSS